MKNADKYLELLEILAVMGEEQMNESQWQLLSDRLAHDPELRDFYVRYIYTDAQLCRHYGTTKNLSEQNDISEPLMDVIETILSEQTVANFDADCQPSQNKITSTRLDTKQFKKPQQRNNLIIPPSIAYGLIAAMVAFVVFIAIPTKTNHITVPQRKNQCSPKKNRNPYQNSRRNL